MSIEVTANSAALEFKSASLTVPALLLSGNDLSVIEQQLSSRIVRAEEFFRNSPLLIDLHRLNSQNRIIDLADTVTLLRRLGLIPIGIRGGTAEQNKEALALSLSVHAMPATNGSSAEEGESETAESGTKNSTADAKNAAQPAPLVENRQINQPVRSGQRVYARGDLTVTATVSAGAEIMAEGNIHVYGSLRGRALAGVLGDTSSRIFCKDLQAELLSIAGIYQLRDDIPKEAQHKAAQISLENQALVVREI